MDTNPRNDKYSEEFKRILDESGFQSMRDFERALDTLAIANWFILGVVFILGIVLTHHVAGE